MVPLMHHNPGVLATIESMILLWINVPKETDGDHFSLLFISTYAPVAFNAKCLQMEKMNSKLSTVIAVCFKIHFYLVISAYSVRSIFIVC